MRFLKPITLLSAVVVLLFAATLFATITRPVVVEARAAAAAHPGIEQAAQTAKPAGPQTAKPAPAAQADRPSARHVKVEGVYLMKPPVR